MVLLILIMVIATSIWVLIDTKKTGVKRGQLKGVANLGPWGWFFACLLLWIVGFPYYLSKREELHKINGKTTYYNDKGGTQRIIQEFKRDKLHAIISIVFALFFFSFFCPYTILSTIIVALTFCYLFLSSEKDACINVKIGIFNNRHRIVFAIMTVLALFGLFVSIEAINIVQEARGVGIADGTLRRFLAILGGIDIFDRYELVFKTTGRIIEAKASNMLLYYQLFIVLWALYNAWIAYNTKKIVWTIPLLIIFLIYLPFVHAGFKYEWYVVYASIFVVILSISKLRIPSEILTVESPDFASKMMKSSANPKEESQEDKLRSLARLKDDGIITNEEFEQKKKQILGL